MIKWLLLFLAGAALALVFLCYCIGLASYGINPSLDHWLPCRWPSFDHRREIPQWLDKLIFMILGISQSLPLAYFAKHRIWLALGLGYLETLAGLLLIRKMRSRRVGP